MQATSHLQPVMMTAGVHRRIGAGQAELNTRYRTDDEQVKSEPAAFFLS